MKKIDAFCHVMPKPYYDRFFELEAGPHSANLRKRVASIPVLWDMDLRFSQMDEFGDYRQLINIAAPPVETLGSPQVAREMARLGNESMAELVRDHPDRFIGFCACVPMEDPDAAVAELDYAVDELGALGAQIYTHIGFEPMDGERFEPFYERMAQSGRPAVSRASRPAAPRC
jgi:predicted TIM-barrel fold metal-dependent hydrolase